jgi:putative ABC transport system permease protein
MYLISKALRNLFKNKGRNIILFLMLFVMITAAVVSLTIFSAVNNVMDETKSFYAGEVSLTEDNAKLQADGIFDLRQNGEGIVPTNDDLREYAVSDYLRFHVFFKEERASATGIRLFDDDYVRENHSGRPGEFIGNVRVFGMLDKNSMDAFAAGEREIVSGNFPETITECMISSDLAELNGLELGDMIKINIMQTDIELAITGLYSDKTEARTSKTIFSPENNARNNIIVQYEFYDKYFYHENVRLFVLKNADDIDAFQNELYGKGLSQYYMLLNDTQRYEAAVTPIDTMTKVVGVFMIIIFTIGCGVVILLNLLALRERKYEIGVFRAIGMPKTKVSVLLLSELTILALSATVLAIAASLFISQPVADRIIGLTSGGNKSYALANIITHINVALSGSVILTVICIAVALALIAGLGFIVSILRFDPIKILSERN